MTADKFTGEYTFEEPSMMHGGPGSGRYPAGSSNNVPDNGREFKTSAVKRGSFSTTVYRDVDKSTVDSVALVERTISKIPQRELDKSAVKRIEIYDNPEDVMARFEELGIDTEGEVKPGAYDFSTNTLFASIYNPDDGDNGEDSNRTLLHEIGHSIVGQDEGMANSWAKAYSSAVESKLPMSSWEHGGPGSGRYPKGSGGAIVSVSYNMSDSTPMRQRENKSAEIKSMLPPTRDWKDPHAKDIAEMAADCHGPGITTKVAIDEKLETFEGIISYYVDGDGVNIAYVASVGQRPHVGGNLIKEAIVENPGKPVQLFADPGAVTYYQHIGMSQLSPDIPPESKQGRVFGFTAEEAASFADMAFSHGGPGSGRYPAGSGGNEQSKTVPSKSNAFEGRESQFISLDQGNISADLQAVRLSPEIVKYGQSEIDKEEAVNNYTLNHYKDVNRFLRGDMEGYQFIYVKDAEEAKSMAAEIESAIDKAPALSPGLELWRGVGPSSGEKLASKAIGDTCSDEAFQSFSLSPHRALTFSDSWGKKTEGEYNVVHQERTLIRAITKGTEKAIYTNDKREREAILQRGTSWKIIQHDKMEMETGPMEFRGTYHIVTVVKQ